MYIDAFECLLMVVMLFPTNICSVICILYLFFISNLLGISVLCAIEELKQKKGSLTLF